MLAVSRGLLRPGDVVLLDEASRGLAPDAVRRLYGAITELVASGRAAVVVEQYAREVLSRADVVYVLRRGDVAFAGEPAELHDDALVRALG
jgi:branched-chain amino acid transport system ATP-binding protein